MAVLYVPHFIQFFANDGTPLSGGKLYTYAATTTTPKATYTTAAGDIENTNPVVLDAYGRATVFLSGSYKFTLTTAADVPIKTTDNVTSFNASTASNEGFFNSFSGDGTTVAFTLTENLGTDEKALFVFAETEYSTNGTFASDTGWTKGAGWTIAAGVATATGAISTALEQSAGVTLVQGKAYSVKYTITQSAGTITLSLGGTAGTARSASGTYSETIIAGSTQTISFGTAGFTGTLDNVSIRDVTGPVVKNPNTYTVNGTALTFATAPASGSNNILVFAPYTLIGAAGAAQVAADQAIAAAANAEAFVNAGAYQFNFDSSTAMSDPGTGDFRLNNATIASATVIAIDALSSTTGNPDVSDAIATWGASTNTIKGQIKIVKQGTPATFAVFNITAAVTDNTGWLQITVAYVAGNGTLTNADACFLQFIRSGDLGATGPQGPTGTVSGASPATMVTNDKVLFLDTSSADALSYDDPATINIDIFGSGAATDGFVLTADGSGGAAWEVLPTASSGWVPIKTVTASASATVDFVNGSGGVVLDGTYKAYAVVGSNILPATNVNDLIFRTSSNAGSSYDSGASDYRQNGLSVTGGASPVGIGSVSTSMLLGTDLSNNSDYGNGLIMYLFNPSAAKRFQIKADMCVANSSGQSKLVSVTGMRDTSADVDAIRFLMATGNITSGTFTLYGLKDA